MATLNVSAQELLPGNAWLACNMQQAAYGAGKSAVSSKLLLCCCMHSVGPFAPDVVIDCWSEIGVHRPAETVAQAVSRAVVIGRRATIELGFCLFCQKAVNRFSILSGKVMKEDGFPGNLKPLLPKRMVCSVVNGNLPQPVVAIAAAYKMQGGTVPDLMRHYKTAARGIQAFHAQCIEKHALDVGACGRQASIHTRNQLQSHGLFRGQRQHSTAGGGDCRGVQNARRHSARSHAPLQNGGLRHPGLA